MVEKITINKFVFLYMTSINRNTMKILIFIPLLSILLFMQNEPQHSFSSDGSVGVSPDDGIADAIKLLENDKSMAGAQWSFCAYNITQKKYIAEKNTGLRLVPASILKVFTTISAYDILGHQTSFETKLLYSGKINDGILNGDIIIQGNGDPTIACDHFGKPAAAATVFGSFLAAMKNIGITSVNGRIIGDASLWGPMLQAPGYMWEDLGNYYGAGASSLNYNENKLKVTFKPGVNIGDSAAVLFITPHPMDPQWVNMVTTAGSSTGDNVFVYGTPFQKVRMLTGTVPAGKIDFTIWASDPDPALRYAFDFQEFLKANGVQVSGQCSSKYVAENSKKESQILIYSHKSPTLKEISLWVNHRSHNVCAESVFRLVGMKLKNTANYEVIADALLAYWKTKGIATGNVILTDGCGLSRTNMITTAFLVDMLVYAQKQTWYKDLYDILPVAGKDGTLKTNFKGTSVENNMHGKSGLLNGVRSYTGYLNNRSGDLIAFAVIANGHMLTNTNIRTKLEALVVSLSDSQ